MRRLVCEYYDGFSFGNIVRQYPDLRGTVTDLLIGDLFTDRVDKVWAADGVALSAGQDADSARGTPGRPRIARRTRHNELMLPDGRKP